MCHVDSEDPSVKRQQEISKWCVCFGPDIFESPFHIIFEKTSVNYHVSVQDVQLHINIRRGKKSKTEIRTMDHNPYLSVIQSYSIKGWGLAGIIQMGNKMGNSWQDAKNQNYWTTIKLIFQSPSKDGNPGGIL